MHNVGRIKGLVGSVAALATIAVELKHGRYVSTDIIQLLYMVCAWLGICVFSSGLFSPILNSDFHYLHRNDCSYGCFRDFLFPRRREEHWERFRPRLVIGFVKAFSLSHTIYALSLYV